MSTTHHELFSNTLQKTHIWLKDLTEELWWEDQHQAYLALRATLHALRDRLTVDEAVHLGAQLPMLIRGFYYEGWTPAGKPVKERHKEEFFAHVKEYFTKEQDIDAEKIVRGVFKVLSKRVTEGEIEDIKHILPPELRDLWP
ncbi:MAG TPA: DUF2267 domain-containing protein [Candidatus Tectomicrobia bacterium]|nr:DUF2267 domain-containing protein [Candidatus Tectomicrobia bacterium]